MRRTEPSEQRKASSPPEIGQSRMWNAENLAGERQRSREKDVDVVKCIKTNWLVMIRRPAMDLPHATALGFSLYSGSKSAIQYPASAKRALMISLWDSHKDNACNS